MRVPNRATSESRKAIMPALAGCTPCACPPGTPFDGMAASGEITALAAASVMAEESLSDYSYFQSGSSGCFKSQRGRRLRTVGMTSKLYEGGGEVVAHSSVHASHGSSPASRPWHREPTRL